MLATSVALVLNGLTLALALVLLILVLWQDSHDESNRFLAVFLFMVLVWISGALIARAGAYVNAGNTTIQGGLRLLDVGFTGASVSIFIYSVVITGSQGPLFRASALLGLGAILLYQLFLLLSAAPRPFAVNDDGILSYGYDVPSQLFFLVFHVSTIGVVWWNRLRVRESALRMGILLFSIGQIVGLMSSHFRSLGVQEDVCALATLMMSYAVVRQQIMAPLLGRAKQLEAVRDVGLAITSRLRLQETLATIAAQAAQILEADGAAIFLKSGDVVELAAVYNLPPQYVGIRVPLGQDVVGTVAGERRARRIDDYRREWKGKEAIPLARDTFGAVVTVPLMFADEVVGVLLVIQGRQGRLFDNDDVHLLELLGPQAAVAIINSRLFEAERELSTDLVVAKNQLETVLTSTENPVVAVDRQFSVIFANPAAVSLLNGTRDVVGECIFDVAPRDFVPDDPRRVLRDLRKRGVHIFEISDQQRTFLGHITELVRPETKGWVIILNDVTQLKELDRLKSQMVQMTSHDLKNPLQAAMSYLELLVEDGQDSFSADMHEYVKIIWTQFTRMYRIISGILDLERVQAGAPVFESCAAEEILARVVFDMADQARSKNLDLVLKIEHELPPVLGDPQQLSQAMANLVDNAIKFTPAGGEVLVEARPLEKTVCVDVRDTGIGIPVEDQAKIFDRFYRGAQQGNVRVSGSGLGLSLVKAIVDRHGGSITFESSVGEGTIFRVNLPVAGVTVS